jgi:hypothetical protein
MQEPTVQKHRGKEGGPGRNGMGGLRNAREKPFRYQGERIYKHLAGLRPEYQFIDKYCYIQGDDEQGNDCKAPCGINILDRYQTSTPFFDQKLVASQENDSINRVVACHAAM